LTRSLPFRDFSPSLFTPPLFRFFPPWQVFSGGTASRFPQKNVHFLFFFSTPPFSLRFPLPPFFLHLNAWKLTYPFSHLGHVFSLATAPQQHFFFPLEFSNFPQEGEPSFSSHTLTRNLYFSFRICRKLRYLFLFILFFDFLLLLTRRDFLCCGLYQRASFSFFSTFFSLFANFSSCFSSPFFTWRLGPQDPFSPISAFFSRPMNFFIPSLCVRDEKSHRLLPLLRDLLLSVTPFLLWILFPLEKFADSYGTPRPSFLLRKPTTPASGAVSPDFPLNSSRLVSLACIPAPGWLFSFLVYFFLVFFF